MSAMANAWVTYWSTSSRAAPESAAARRNLKVSCTTSGASPWDGSSTRINRGCRTYARGFQLSLTDSKEFSKAGLCPFMDRLGIRPEFARTGIRISDFGTCSTCCQ